jgi:hypothetical protein
MDESTTHRHEPSRRSRTSEMLAAIDADVEAELAHVEASADPEDDDEPEREVFATRLRSLRDAIASVEQAPG